MRLFAKRVVVSQYALNKISESILLADNRYEVGGVFLGHRQFRTCFIIDATVPNDQKFKSTISFELAGESETKAANDVASLYCKPPALMGIWHSHIGGMDTFSAQDRRSNQVFSALVRGAISAIAIPAPNAKLDTLISYFISSKGKETMCDTIADSRRRIPQRYLRKRLAENSTVIDEAH